MALYVVPELLQLPLSLPLLVLKEPVQLKKKKGGEVTRPLQPAWLIRTE